MLTDDAGSVNSTLNPGHSFSTGDAHTGGSHAVHVKFFIRSHLPLSGTLELNLPKRHVALQTNDSCPLNVYFSIKDEDGSFFSAYPLTRKYHPGAKHFSPHPVSSVELSYTVFPVWPLGCTRRLSWADRRVLRFC